MLTLNQATSMTKNFVKWAGIGVASLVILFIGFKIGVFIKSIVAPTPKAPPTVTFGKLPEAKFPASIEAKKYSYSIDTVTGSLPEFSDRAKVFLITPESADLLALQKAKEKAQDAGFSPISFRLTDNEYQWSDLTSPISRKLKMNIFSYQFSIDSQYFSDQDILSKVNLPLSSTDAQLAAIAFLNRLSLFPEDINKEATTISLFSISNSELVAASSFASAQIIKVDFFQKDIDKLPIYYPDPLSSTMSFYISGGPNNPQIVKANFFHQTISNKSATYPIKTSKEAFAELEQGKAYIASPGKEDVLIQDVSLGYYMSDTRQEFLMPIIVFKGNNGFVAYIPAVRDEWISK